MIPTALTSTLTNEHPTARLTGSPSPWAAWNLRFNPFGEPSSEDVPGLIVENVDDLQAWVETPGHALQLLGDKGRGKTARLRALEPRLQIPYVYLGEGEPIPYLPRCGGLLLDEAQRLPRGQRRRLFNEIDQLALSSHENLERDLSAAGWEVRTVHVGGFETSQLDVILTRRLEWARRGPGPLPQIRTQTRDTLTRHHGDDLRAILDDLYERFQKAIALAEHNQERHVKV